MQVLVISAHMDDEVLGVGGTIARHAAAFDRVTTCIVSNRATDHRFKPSVIRQEKQAARRAARILGAAQLKFLDLKDELLDRRLLDVIVPLERVIQEVKPTVVYTHHRGDGNQDHRAVFQATMVACRTFAPHRVKRLLCYEVPSSTEQAPPFSECAFQPNFYVEIGRFLDRKVRALKAYTRELREFPHPRSIKGIQVLAEKRGMEIGLHSAEAFMVVRDGWL